MEEQKKKTSKKKILIAILATAAVAVGGCIYFKKNPEKLAKIFKPKKQVEPVVVDTLSVTVSEVLPESKPRHRHRHHPHKFMK